jgi:hypothetical protein
MFNSRAMGETPIRTYGKFYTDTSGKLTFEYRPWLVLPKRTLELPPGKYAVGRGLFYPEITRVDGDEPKTYFILPPRYRGHEADLAKACNTMDIRDVGLLHGFKSIGRAMKSLFGIGTRKELPAPA